MKIGIYTNLYKDVGLEVTRRLVELLKNGSYEFYLYRNLHDEFPDVPTFDEHNYKFLSVMITIGGDGTVLNIAQDCIEADIPMLTVNKGTRGFLNEVELDKLGDVIPLLAGEGCMDKRRLLKAELNGKVFYALNEALVTRRDAAKMVVLDAKIDGIKVEKYFCDGLIVCSPTGSTAYSLSAGGPIVSPKAEVMCITPISSHCLHSRPIVVNDSETVEISYTDNEYDDCVLMVDGVCAGEIKRGDVVRIEKSNKTISFIRKKSTCFYTKLLDGLS